VARVILGGDLLRVHLSLFGRFGACVAEDVVVPLTAVVSARWTERPWAELRGSRAPGTSIGRVIALGTWRHPTGRDFVAVYGRGPAVVVELAGHRLSRLVLSTPDAEGLADDIEEAAAETRIASALRS
jgi:hypothetical protein